MTTSATISTRRITAFLLAVLFLSIHFIKAVHKHSKSEETVKQEQVIQKDGAGSLGCDICDFHFSKDAIGSYYSTVYKPLPIFPSYQAHFSSAETSSIGLNYADRGPPFKS